MTRIGFLLSVTAILLLPAIGHASAWTENSAGYEKAMADQAETGVPVVVYFTAEWCPHCKELNKEVLDNKDVGKFLAPFGKVMVHSEDTKQDEALGKRF